jgi:hypothetical protein
VKGNLKVKKILFVAFIVIGLVIGSALPSLAQKKKPAASTPAGTVNNPLAALPPSDGVISVDMQRLLNELLPRVLADSPTKLADVNARIDRAKTRTGIDIRKFERVAVGLHFLYPTETTVKIESVAIARGKFDAATMLAAGIELAKGKYTYREEAHGGKTIYIFDGKQLFGDVETPQVIDEQAKKSSKSAKAVDDLLDSVLNFKNGEIGIVALDANSLALGELAMVRATIDAGGRSRSNAGLIQLATKTPNAVIGFGSNVPPNVSKYIGVDSDEITRNLDAIKQVYGSITDTSGGYELQTIAVTETAAQAQQLSNMLEGVRDLGGFFAGSLSGEKGKLAKTALQNLKISKQANEVQMRIEMAQADVAMLVRIL